MRPSKRAPAGSCLTFCTTFVPLGSLSPAASANPTRGTDLRRSTLTPTPSICPPSCSSVLKRYHASSSPCLRSTPSMLWRPAGMLRDAVEIKRAEVDVLEKLLMDRPDHPVNMRRSFYATEASHVLTKSLRRRDGTLAVFAAVKRFLAPSKAHRLDDPTDMDGDSRAELVCALENITEDVRSLWACGVDAALFYTDAVRHGVDLPEFRKTARMLQAVQQNPLPLVRHDLIIDPVQIAEAVEAGASAVNIVAAAALPQVPDLLDAATMMGIEAIVECHTQLEVDYAMESGATIIFINNWDRTRNVLVPETVDKLIANIPTFVLTVAGGGISSASRCWELLDMGYNGVVLGTALLQSNRPKAFIEEIRAFKRHTGDVFAGDMGIPFAEGTN